MRITKKDFEKAVTRLEQELGMELIVNQWDKHVSVYTKGKNNTCSYKLVQANSYRAAHEQAWAAIRAAELCRAIF